MNDSEKIILTAILTWVLFGLLNLFGQPKFFLPPLPFDGLILAACALVLFIKQKPHELNKIGYWMFLSFVSTCLFAAFYESFNIDILFFIIIASIISCCILFPIVVLKNKTNKLYSATLMIFYLFSILTFILLLTPFLNSDMPILFYFMSGMMVLVINIFFRNQQNGYIEKILWLYFLNVFFDGGQYTIMNYFL